MMVIWMIPAGLFLASFIGKSKLYASSKADIEVSNNGIQKGWILKEFLKLKIQTF